MTSGNQSLENITGTLYECVLQTIPGTALTSAEITTERRDNEGLRKNWFWTANFGLYRKEGDEAVLYFGGRKGNPIFDNIKKATEQLIHNKNYRPAEKDIAAVLQSVESGDTLKVKLSELDLKRYNGEFSYFEVGAKLNPDQRTLAERVYDFAKNKKMFDQAGVVPRIYVLNPNYVQREAQNSAVARACWLDDFGYGSDFFAYDRSVGDISSALRGVRRVVAEGDAPNRGGPYRKAAAIERTDYNSLVEALTASPTEAAKTLNDQTASALLGIISQYLTSRQQ